MSSAQQTERANDTLLGRGNAPLAQIHTAWLQRDDSLLLVGQIDEQVSRQAMGQLSTHSKGKPV